MKQKSDGQGNIKTKPIGHKAVIIGLPILSLKQKRAEESIDYKYQTDCR